MSTSVTSSAPFRDPILRAYLDDVLEWHGYMRTLGLPTMKDSPSVPINRLYVAPALSATPTSPDAKELEEGENILQVLEEHRRLVVQGDPGSGKSTLVNWLAWRLAAGLSAPLPDFLQGAIPIPLILRELNPEGMESFDKLLVSFLKRPVAQALNQDAAPLIAALKDGRALVLVDGLDELPENQRKQLIGSLRKAFARYRKAIWLITSRVVGFDESLLDVDGNEALTTEDAIKQRFLLEGVPDGLLNFLQGKSLTDVLTAAVKPVAMEAGNKVLNELAKQTEAKDPYEKILRNTLMHGIEKALPNAERRPWRKIHRTYVMPFDDKRIENFSRAWYQIRGSLAQESSTCDSFLHSVRANPATHALARNPQILTLMALVFRTRLDLPQGRALLYEYITQAYLESIDQAYGILDARFTWQEKKRLLSKVGFEMQLRRILDENKEQDGSDYTDYSSESTQQGILFSESEVKFWIVEAMHTSRNDACDELATAFLDHISRRSGLLLPRGEGQYAFVHLTFQEYFAALYLKDEICSPDFVENNKAVDPRITTDTLYNWSGNSLWNETLLFLHELVGNTPRWANRIESWVFGKHEVLSANAPESHWNRLTLRVLVADDIHTGLNQEICMASFTQACESVSEIHASDLFLKYYLQGALRALYRSPQGSEFLLNKLSSKPQGWVFLPDCGDNFEKIISAPCIANNARILWLSDTGIVNLDWVLYGYRDLEILVLHEQHLTNVLKIGNCVNLRLISIVCPRLSDITPLLDCDKVSEISIISSNISDLSPFVSMKNINITGDLGKIPADQAEVFRQRAKLFEKKHKIAALKQNKSNKPNQHQRGAEASKPPKKLR
ncbi:NACHT domain-containing protein [Azonexus hydrophilus]|uniref:NACHT domain-containing protein n=1 Tax=Azonexus hydrophilus TaxID=418702 RepID=UPI002490874B|nr:NACHT domain-containing protein [Azonexus hydrophilus]